MPKREKTPGLQPLGWLLVGLLSVTPALAVDTAEELLSTREALRSLEQQQLQRLRELERMEEEISRSAQRSLVLRSQERELNQQLSRLNQALARQEIVVLEQEQDLAQSRVVLRQLLHAQWLRERHPQADQVSGSPLSAVQRREFDRRMQATRVVTLEQQHDQLAELRAAQAVLAEAQAELLAARAEMAALLDEVARQEAQHLALVEQAQRRAREDALELERLERNAATLEAVLQRMGTQQTTAVGEATDRGGAGVELAGQQGVRWPEPELFPHARGQLPWPVPGPILYRYGSARGTGVTSTWRGEVFAVQDATPVRAVYDGRVVYADWMRGFGFLVILDHGQGYLSLYGNAREILVNPEQHVLQGDLLAYAGGASTVIAPGLYFELRHHGQTLNPAAWWDSK